MYEKYKKSDGEKRIWLMAILGIFISFLTLAFRERILFSGPAAVIFWLLAGAVQNLGTRGFSFGLTESRLDKPLALFFKKNTGSPDQHKSAIMLKKNCLDSCQPRFDFYKH